MKSQAVSGGNKAGNSKPGKPPVGIHAGAVEHYVHADAYDERYRGRSEDVGFYTALVKRGDAVLEYGAGTGRLTFPILARGASVLAVDLSKEMLAVLRKRAKSEIEKGTLRTECADMRVFRPRGTFDVVVCGFHTFCHLYSLVDVREFLGHVKAALRPGGIFAFDVPMPHIDLAGYDNMSQVCVTDMDGPEGPELLTQRWYQPEELRMHLHYAGFSKPKFFGDFTKNSPNSDTDFLQVVVKKKG